MPDLDFDFDPADLPILRRRKPGPVPWEALDVDPADVTDEKTFVDDLDVDSLSMVEVAMAAEEKFGVTIPDEELPKLKTVGDAVTYIASN